MNLTRDACTAKKMFMQVSTSYNQLVWYLENDGAWADWKQSEQRKRLEAAHHDVKSELNQWHLEFITENDFSNMRKKYAADRVSVELRKFMNLKPNIEKLH